MLLKHKFQQLHLLVIGSSHAARLRRQLRGSLGHGLAHVGAEGIPGGLLSSETHRVRLLRMVEAYRPQEVLLILGGNDLAARDMDIPELTGDLQLLGLGMEALGVTRLWVLPVLPRTSTRPGDVSPTRFEERRRALNRIWGTRFRRAPIACLNVAYPEGMVGRDGVHLSERGWRVLIEIIRGIQ